MSDSTNDTAGFNPSVDDTAAFQRFYLDEKLSAASAPAPEAPRPSLFHRLFVGWWKKSPS